MAFKGHFANGTVEGTGSAINVSCGFTPSYVKVINIDGDCEGEWTSDMPAASMWKSLKIVDNGTATANSVEHVTSNGISTYAGVAAGAGKGFTIGADSDLNASAETIVWIAFGQE